MKTAIAILLLVILGCFKVLQHSHSGILSALTVVIGLFALITLWLLLMIQINEPNIPEVEE